MKGLRGRRIAVTREEEADGPLCTLLREAGAIPLSRPTVEMARLMTPGEIRGALAGLDQARWLLLTSPRAGRYLAEAGVFEGPMPPGLRVGSVGPGTTQVLEAAGWPVHLTPEEATGEELLAAILDRDPNHEGTVLFPASGHASDTLPRGLEAAGYHVVHIPLYEPRDVRRASGEWERDLDHGLAGLTFSSPSAVKALDRSLGEHPVGTRLRTLPAATQGPVTGDAVRAAGWRRVRDADPHTFPGVVAAMAALLDSTQAVTEVSS